MRTVEDYRGLQVHVFDPGEEVPSWVSRDVQNGRSVMARGDFGSASALAHILDRYIDEMLQGGEPGPATRLAGPRR
jgi:hypothetical protein